MPENGFYDSNPAKRYSIKYLDRNTRILFVDDDQEICNMVKYCFYHTIKNIHISRNFAQAVKYLKKHSVDIIITDINLPGKDGFELVEWIKGKENLSGIPIVMITGVMLDKNSVIKSKKMGVDRFIAKPFDISRLVKDVDMALGPKYKKKSLETYELDEKTLY